MASDSAARSARPGLSLYANLLDPSSNKNSAPGTILRAAVVFKQPVGEDLPQNNAAAEKQQISAASLRFQPTKRPHLSAQKPKSKPPTPRPLTAASSNLQPDVMPSDSVGVTARPSAKTTLADWTAEGQDDDVNGFYGGEKRQRGGRKKRKKNKENSHVPQNWDDIYDPCRPNNYEDYKHSDEKILEVKEWKDKLYAHRLANRHNSESDSSDNQYRPQLNRQFAPPGPSFMPSPSFDNGGSSKRDLHSVEAPNDPISDDLPARRMRLSPFDHPAVEPLNPETVAQQIRPPSVSPPPPPPAFDPPLQLNSSPSLGRISREPVRYNLPAAPSDLPTSEAELEDVLRTELKEESPADDAPRSLRPGQKGFAERLMSKYGWSKGSGLGASGSGIVNPLRVQIEKQKKKPDSEGGGFAGPGGRGKIIGGRKKGGPDAGPENGRFGVMSEVIVLQGMVDGMDLDAELEGAGDGGLMQEIGEECGDKYGRVERVFIDRSDVSKAPVFVKFTSHLSALRAVNALEGRIFNGNVISARFFNNERFEAGEYR